MHLLRSHYEGEEVESKVVSFSSTSGCNRGHTCRHRSCWDSNLGILSNFRCNRSRWLSTNSWEWRCNRSRCWPRRIECSSGICCRWQREATECHFQPKARTNPLVPSSWRHLALLWNSKRQESSCRKPKRSNDHHQCRVRHSNLRKSSAANPRWRHRDIHNKQSGWLAHYSRTCNFSSFHLPSFLLE